jgi:hypothetical protein
MKLIASIGAALTLAGALVALTSPAASQTAQRVVVQAQPIGPVVVAPSAEIAPPPIAVAPAPEEPPRVTVTWEGGQPSFAGVVESVGEKYTLFAPSGAVRPTSTPNLEKQGNAPPREEAQDEEQDETP